MWTESHHTHAHGKLDSIVGLVDADNRVELRDVWEIVLFAAHKLNCIEPNYDALNVVS